MTPFGEKIRDLRRQKGVTLKRMAADLHISAAYLSALEHGRRGLPRPGLVMQILGYFNVIWDEAEAVKALAAISDPKVRIDTAGLAPQATLLANRLQARIRQLSEADLARLLAIIDAPPSLTE